MRIAVISLMIESRHGLTVSTTNALSRIEGDDRYWIGNDSIRS